MRTYVRSKGNKFVVVEGLHPAPPQVSFDMHSVVLGTNNPEKGGVADFALALSWAEWDALVAGVEKVRAGSKDDGMVRVLKFHR